MAIYIYIICIQIHMQINDLVDVEVEEGFLGGAPSPRPPLLRPRQAALPARMLASKQDLPLGNSQDCGPIKATRWTMLYESFRKHASWSLGVWALGLRKLISSCCLSSDKHSEALTTDGKKPNYTRSPTYAGISL